MLIAWGMLFGAKMNSPKNNEQFSVELSVSPKTAFLDETVQVTVQLLYPASHTVNLESIRSNLFKPHGFSMTPFNLINEIVEKLPERGIKVTFTLDPLLQGTHTLTLYDVVFTPKEPQLHRPVVIVSNITSVKILLPPKLTLDLKPFPLLPLEEKLPITITKQNRKKLLENKTIFENEAKKNRRILEKKILPWEKISGIFLFAIVFLLARMQPKQFLGRKKNGKPRSSAKQQALAVLACLEKSQFVEKSTRDPFCFDLSCSIKKYIEERYQLASSAKTTPELLEEISKSTQIDEKIKPFFEDFLFFMDRVKFASHEPSAQECIKMRQMAKEFIFKSHP